MRIRFRRIPSKGSSLHQAASHHTSCANDTLKSSAGPKSQPEFEQIASITERLRCIPDRYREFVQDEDWAAREHGISRLLLTELCDVGLPFKDKNDSRYFDRLDLANVALTLHLANARSMAMRGWANSLRATAKTPSTTFEVEIQANCPVPGHQGDCAYDLSGALRSLDGYVPGDAVTSGLLRRHVARPGPHQAAWAGELAGLVKSLHYYLLPEELRADLGFLAQTGLADCRLAAVFLTREAKKIGLEARYSFGLFLAVPYSIRHSWTEICDGETWTAFDPHLINLLIDWSLLDPAQWPSHRSIGGCTVRAAGHDVYLITHHGACALMSLSTKRLGKAV